MNKKAKGTTNTINRNKEMIKREANGAKSLQNPLYCYGNRHEHVANRRDVHRIYTDANYFITAWP